MGIGAGFEKVPDWTAEDYLYEPDSENLNIDGDEIETDETSEDDDDECSDRGTTDFRRKHTDCAIAVDMEDRSWGSDTRNVLNFFIFMT